MAASTELQTRIDEAIRGAREQERVEGANFTTTSLKLDDDITIERAVAVGAFVGRTQKASSWWVGDFILECERLFGESAAQIAEALDMSESTMQAWALTCSKIPAEMRDERISFSTYIDIAYQVLVRGQGTLENVRAIVAELVRHREETGRNIGHKRVRELLVNYGYEQIEMDGMPIDPQAEVQMLRAATARLQTQLEDTQVSAGTHVRCPKCRTVQPIEEARVVAP